MSEPKEIASIVKMHRKAAKLTQLQLAELAGVGKTVVFDIDTAKAKAYHEAMVQLKDLCNIKPEVSLDLLAGASGIVTQADKEKDIDACWFVVKECLAEAIDDLNKMRSREGDFIAADITKRLDYIENCLTQIKDKSQDLLANYQQRLQERIVSLTKGIIEIELYDTNRI